MELVEKVGGRVYRSAACFALGQALSLAGDWQEALPCLEEAHALRLWAATPNGGLPTALLQCGEPERALSLAREDAATAASQGYALEEVALQIELAEVAARCGHEAEARAALVRASDLATRIECRILVPTRRSRTAAGGASRGAASDQEMGATGHAERLEQELVP